MTTFDISDHIYSLLQDEPFFAALSRQINKRSTTDIPTAGIKFNGDNQSYEMFYNPSFMEKCDDSGKRFVLMHEMYHAAFGHCTYRKKIHDNLRLANLAMDLAINSLSHMRPIAVEGACLPREKPFENIAYDEMSSEWYLQQILKEQEKNPEKFKDKDSFDDHSGFGEEGGESDEEALAKQIASEKLRDAVEKAVKEVEKVGEQTGRAKGWGSVSRQHISQIKTYANAAFKLDPKKVLASFIKASAKADTKSSVIRRNRRLPGKKFGRKYARTARIAVSIDQSGSVSDELLSRVFEWLSDLAKFASFVVVPFDDRVFEEKIYTWKKGEQRKRERVLCGGTDFNAPTKWVNEGNFDGHIIITDMMAPKPIRSKCQRLWLTDKWGSQSTYFQPVGEKVLVLE
jgi:predicted metal-dependent peptidase